MWLLFLGACGWSVGGRWNFDRVAVEGPDGEAEVFEAGFVDLRGTNNKGTEPVMLMRYWYDLEAGAFVPDPTPDILVVEADVVEVDDDDILPFVLAFPVSDTETVMVPFEMDVDGGRAQVLESEGFPGGTMVLELSR